MMRIFIILCTLGLAACQNLTPNKVAEATVDSVLALSTEVDLAEKRGWINNAAEDKLQNRLIAALRLMGDTQALVTDAGCDAALDRQQCIQSVLLDVEFKLREASNEPR